MPRPATALLRALSAALLAVAVASAGVEAKASPRKPAAHAAKKASATKNSKKSSAKKTSVGEASAKKRAVKPARGAKTTRGTGAKGRAARTAGVAARRSRPVERVAERPAVHPAPAPAPAPLVTVLPAVDLATALGGDLVILPEVGATAPAPAPARPFAALSRSATSLVDELVNRARGQLGTRYVLGGSRPGESLDCSSFARYAMEALGFRLPRTADEQARLGRPVPRDQAALKPGDLLTFGSRRRVDHVGIYLGEGRFIHASVKSGRVIETTIDRNNSLFRKWLGARRLIADADSGHAGGS